MFTEKHFSCIVPHPPHSATDHTFVNRSAELESLNDAYKTSCNYTRRFITGFSGVGKTTLVRQFLKNLDEDGKTYFCIWLQGNEIEKLEKDSENFVQSCFGIRRLPKDNAHSADSWASFFKKNVECVSNKSPKDRKIIIVITSVVEETYEYAKALSGQLSKMTSILLVITSGITPSFGDTTEHILLKSFDKSFSKQLITSKILGTWPENDLEDICKVLSNFPLCLVQAISFIKHEHRNQKPYTIADYVEKIKENGMKMKQLVNHNLSSDSETTVSIVNSVTITVQKLQSEGDCGKLAVAMIQILAWLDEGSIDEEEFIQINGLHELSTVKFSKEQKPVEHQKAISRLVDYKLIEQSGRNVNLANHSILHRVIRLVFEQSKAMILNVLVKNFIKFRGYLQSTAFIQEISDSLGDLCTKIKQLEKRNGVGHTDVYEAEMHYVKYLHICDPMRAIRVLQARLDRYESLNPESFDTRKSKMTTILMYQGALYKEMQLFGQEILLREKLNRDLEEDQHKDIFLDNLLHLSTAYYALGLLENASNYWTSIVHNEESSNKDAKVQARKLLIANGFEID